MSNCKSINVDPSHFDCLNKPGIKGLSIGPGMGWMFKKGQLLIIKAIGKKCELITTVKLIDGGELFLEPVVYSEQGFKVAV